MTTHEDRPRGGAMGEAEAAGKRAFAARASATAAPRPAVESVRDVEAAAADKLQVPAVALRTPKVSWWATATDDQLAQWMDELSYWVEWLVATYELNHNFVPACWTLHPALVQELWALHCLHVLNHMGGAGSNALAGPITFAASFASWRERIRELLPDLGNCRNGHQPTMGDRHRDERREQYPATAADFRWRWPDQPIEHPDASTKRS